MIFELRLAVRFLGARRRSLARFTAAAAVAGIAAGVASLVVAQALGRGFQTEMRDRVIGHNAHVAVFRKDGAAIADWQDLRLKLASLDGVRQADATTYESVILSGKNGSSHAVLRVWFDDVLGADSISVGSELARRLGLAAGDEAEIIAIDDGNIGSPARLRVAGILETGLYDYDSSWVAITEDGYKNKIGGGNFTPGMFSVFANDPEESQAIAQEIENFLGGEYVVLSWQEANRPLFAAMTLERRVAAAVLLLIILVAALNITTTLALLVNERRFDIGVLRTCGTRTKSFIAVFLIQGALIGGLGIAAGLALGHAACYLINRYELISLPAEVYSIGSVTLRPAASDSIAAAGGALAICLFASIYPALRGSKVKPLDNLRV